MKNLNQSVLLLAILFQDKIRMMYAHAVTPKRKKGVHVLILRSFGIILLYHTSVYRHIEKVMVKLTF